MAFQLGSISTGTLRDEDLAPIFISHLVESGADYGDIPEDVDGLIEALNAICPPFVYFGTLKGDGSDFGFWADWDSLEEANYNANNAQLTRGYDFEIEEEGIIVNINDHGNVTVYDMDRNELWSCV